MEENRIDAMQAVIDNLRAEGQTSRADVVQELVDEVRKLRTTLFFAGRAINRTLNALGDWSVDEAKRYCITHRDRINVALGEDVALNGELPTSCKGCRFQGAFGVTCDNKPIPGCWES